MKQLAVVTFTGKKLKKYIEYHIKERKLNKQMFLVEVEFDENSWPMKNGEYTYKKGGTLMIPVFTNNVHSAMRKVRKEHWGSEYPNYHITRVGACDGLFRPIF